MWEAISRFMTYSYGMIARLTNRTFQILTGFRRFALPWAKKSTDDSNSSLPTVISITEVSQSFETMESNNKPSPVSSSIENDPVNEPTTVFVVESEIQNILSQPPSKKLKLEPSASTSNSSQSNDNIRKTAAKITPKVKKADSVTAQDSAKLKKKQKLKDIKTAKKDQKGAENEDSSRSRPNSFVAIQVSNPEILSGVFALQQKILSKEITSKAINKFSKTADIFKDTMVKKEKLHFTLHVFHLKDNEDKERAKSALESCYVKYKSDFESHPMVLNIEGLGHFRNGVIFAKIEGTDHVSRLETLSEDIRRAFEERNIPGDPKPFRPHLTIAKLSKSKTLAKKKIRSYPPEIWSDLKTEHLGYQTVDSLQLLSMMDTDPNTGYYGSIAQFSFLPGAYGVSQEVLSSENNREISEVVLETQAADNHARGDEQEKIVANSDPAEDSQSQTHKNPSGDKDNKIDKDYYNSDDGNSQVEIENVDKE